MFGGTSVSGCRLISSAHAVEGQSGMPKVTAASHLRKNRNSRKQRFGCFLSFIDSATTAKGMRFKFPLNIQPNFLVYECKGVADKMRAECVSLCVMSYRQLVFPTHIFTP